MLLCAINFIIARSAEFLFELRGKKQKQISSKGAAAFVKTFPNSTSGPSQPTKQVNTEPRPPRKNPSYGMPVRGNNISKNPSL
jgi:hypothetical protein